MSNTNPLVRGAVLGAGAGVVASVAMGMYAMVASLLKDTGFFTPLHHIATLFAAPDAMMGSMTAGMEGRGFEISAGAALLGLVIHMMTGAMFGALFGAVAARLPLRSGSLAGIGLVFGFAVFMMSAYVGLPVAAGLLGVDDLAMGAMAGMNPIADMAEMAGWGTFIAEHLVFGLVTGALVAAGLRKPATVSA